MKIAQNWYNLLEEEFNKPYFKNLQKFIDEEYSKFEIYPKSDNISLPSCDFFITTSTKETR